jgi:hypothetical protein
MTNNGAGVFSTVIPGQAVGVTAAFFVQAADNFAPTASSAFPDDAPLRECVVRWGDTTIPGTLPTYRFWLSQTNVARWSAEEKMSNKPKDITFIYGTNRVIYNAGGWFHGSPYHSPGYDSPAGVSCDYDLGFPKDDPLLGETDINLFRPGNGGGDPQAQREIHAYWMGDQLGVPFLYHRPVFVFVNGQRRETVFHDAQQPNGDFIDQWYPDDADGDLHKIQLGFEFGDTAYGAGEPGYTAAGADFNRYTTTGGAFKMARYRQTLPRRSSSTCTPSSGCCSSRCGRSRGSSTPSRRRCTTSSGPTSSTAPARRVPQHAGRDPAGSRSARTWRNVDDQACDGGNSRSVQRRRRDAPVPEDQLGGNHGR